MKIIKKLAIFILIAILSLIITTNSYAASNVNATLKLVEDNVCKINLDNKATLEKKVIKFDEKNKAVTIGLTVTNTMQNEKTEKPAEIFLVIDNSSSMIKNKIGNVTRKAKIIESANTLVDKLFKANSKAKVGIVSFSSLDSLKGETEGTINDAKLELKLNSSKSDVKAAISSIASKACGPRTNIEAALEVASNNYSSTSNTSRYIVLLTDGVPDNALNGEFGTYIGQVGSRTKAKLKAVEKSGIKIFATMVGLNSQRVETQSNKTYKALAEEVFGTVENPTTSKYYYVTDAEVENTIINTIYSDLVEVKENTLTDIVIKDYFPKEIIDNFNFAHVTKPNIGDVSAKVNTKDNSITWKIKSLKAGETAKLSYKLTLKDNFDKAIINKVLPTNKKLDFSANDKGKTISKNSDVSPKVKVIVPTDKTVAKKPIPQTGQSSILSIVIITISGIAIIAGLRYKFFNK